MANIPRPTQESVAYQDAYRAKEQVQLQPEKLRVVKTHRKAVRMQQIVCIAIVASIAAVLVNNQMQLTELTSEVAVQEAKLQELHNEYVSLKAQQDRALSLTYVEDYARNVLGMVRMDASSVEYIEMNNPDRIEVVKKPNAFFDQIKRCCITIKEYLA